MKAIALLVLLLLTVSAQTSTPGVHGMSPESTAAVVVFLLGALAVLRGRRR